MNILNVDFNALAAEVHENAKSKGFWDKQYNHDEKVMLIVSELGEALEAHRKDKFADIPAYNYAMHELQYLSGNERREKAFATHMKDTFEDELADTAIRVMDMAVFRELKVNYRDELGQTLNLPSNYPYENVGQSLLTIVNVLAPYNLNEHNIMLVLNLLAKLAEQHDTDLIYHIKEKMWYNSTRERMHGKSY